MTASEALALAVSGLALVGAIVAVSRTIFVSEARIQENKRRIDESAGKAMAFDAIIAEQGRFVARLSERVGHHAEILSSKASVESVAAIREMMESFRRDVTGHLDRIEKKLDDR
jgi:hypothetical protein